MSNLDSLYGVLATEMVQTIIGKKGNYAIPTMPQAQCIVIPVVREVVAPIIIRNNDAAEVTQMEVDLNNETTETRIRMIASKTKGVERRRGSQILRALQLGGYSPTNKTFVGKNNKPGDALDLNSFIFGDSANSPNAILSVHAAVLYSDALSLEAPSLQTEEVFRQGGISEDGGNYDPETKKTSNNIFTTYSVKVGTRFVQTLVLLGNRITIPAFQHLLLSLGLAGAYGGSTATTGTNIKTSVAGVYWGVLERSINAPVEILRYLHRDNTELLDTPALVEKLYELFAKEYPNAVEPSEMQTSIQYLVEQLERRDSKLVQDYAGAAHQSAKMFNMWFESGETSASKNKKKNESVELTDEEVEKQMLEEEMAEKGIES